MAELIIPNEKVRDLTEAPRRLPIEVEGSVTHDMLLTIWSTMNPKDSNATRDLGSEWVDEVVSKVPDDLKDELLQLGGPYCFVWLAISSFLLTAPHPHDLDTAIDWLEKVEDNRLRRWILSYGCHSEDQGLIEQAASGDIEALKALAGESGKDEHETTEHFEWMVSNTDLPTRYAAALRRYRSEVFADYEDDFADAIRRAAAARRAAPGRGDAKTVIEEVTSGIAFDIPLGTQRVRLVPSVVTRPLSIVDVHRGTLIVYYGLADEFLNSDPEAPPSYLVRTYKALSDERRLRIMRRLSEGEASLDQLTEMLGLSKSTVHHHMSQLRAAGLVRVQLPSHEEKGKHKIYSLREQSLTDAAGFLDSYLRPNPEEQKHA